MKQFTPLIKATALITLFTGLLVLIGWFAHIEFLKSIINGFPTMKFNSAVCFISCGISLLLTTIEGKTINYIQKFTAFLVLIIALISFAQYIISFNTGIDELLINDTLERVKKQPFPGRMASASAFCFIILSTALITFSAAQRIIKLITQYALHLVTLMSFIVLMGYIFGVPRFYELSFFTSVAINTNILFFLLSIAISLFNYSMGFTGLFTGAKTGSIMARRLYPLIIVVIIILAFLRLELHWHNLVKEDFGIALFATSFLLVSLFVIDITATYLNKIDDKRSNAEASIKKVNRKLEILVEERTKELNQIDERFLLATANAKIGIWDLDIINNVLTWDDRMYQLYGIQPSDFSGAYDAWLNGLHPDDKENGDAAVGAAITGTKEFDTEFRVIWPDGSVHYLKANALVQRDSGGRAIKMIGTNWDITKEKEQLDRITQSEQQYHNMIAGVQDYAIILLDADGKIQNWNSGAEKIKQYKQDEIVGKRFHIFYTEEELQNNLPDTLLNIAREKGKASDKGWRVRKDGTLFWASVIITALHDANGAVNGFTKVTRDLTEVKKAADELKNNERKFQLMLDAIGDNAWEHNYVTRKTTFAKNIEEVIGYRPDEITDDVKIWWDNIYEEDKWLVEESDKLYKARLQDSHSLEYRMWHKDGSIKWVLDRGVIIDKDEKGNPLRIVGTHTDITKRKNTEASLHKVQKQFEAFMDYIPAMTWIMDKDAVYQYHNKLYIEAYRDIFPEGQFKTLVGKNYADLLPADIAKERKASNDNVLQKGSVMESIRSVKRVDGRDMIIREFRFPMQINKDVTLMGGIAIDITEQFQKEQDLKALNEQLVTSNNELEQFAYVASHDLQEPLRMVSSFMQLLDKKYKPQLDDTARQYIDFAVDGAERMKALILDLLSFSRIGTEKQFNETIDVNKIIDEVKLNLIEAITESSAEIIVKEMPVLKGNKLQVTQLFQNLLGNAIKYRSNQTPHIEIGCKKDTDKYNFYIKDNGIGIDNRYYEKIFVIFQRLHNKTDYSGTGVGLSICKKIVEKHGGNISVISEKSKGSTFNFSIAKNKT